MDFCQVCQNMLYLVSKTRDLNADADAPAAPENGGEEVLVKYCKHCKWSTMHDMGTSSKPIRVSHTLYSEDDLLYKQHYNPYLRFDPTLPRISDPAIKCKNPECTGPKENPQMIYVKYHPIDMKYFYCCDYCGMRTEYNKK